MNAFDVLSGFIPLVIVGLLALGLARLARRAHGADPVDAATLIRQLVLFGLLFVTMVLTASGIVWTYGELAETSGRSSNRQLAQALALVALGLPVFAGLGAIADRRLSQDQNERESIAWIGYLTIASVTSLVVAMVGAHQVVRSVIDDRPGVDFDDGALVSLLVWGTFFAIHWVVARPRHRARGDLHLASVSFVGLVALGIGQAGLLAVLGEQIYDAMLGRPAEDLRVGSAPWAALFVVGCVVWIGVWLRNYESADRSDVWYVLVLPVGALTGFIVAVGTASRAAYLLLVWLLGEPVHSDAGDHFASLPALIGIGATGVIGWLYHRTFVAGDGPRTSVQRVYDYLLMAAALVTGVIGALIVGASLLDDGSTDKNLAIAGITLLSVGGFTWSTFATRVVAHQAGEPGLAELRSPVRRSYLYATLGIGGLAVLIAAVDALQGFIEHGLDATLDVDTFVEHRVQLVTVLIVGAVLWFHNLVLRSDQRHLGAAMPPPPERPWPSRIIVLGNSGDTRIDNSKHPGTSVEYWHPTDDAVAVPTDGPPLDLDALDVALAARPADDVLVVINGDSTTVIPFER